MITYILKYDEKLIEDYKILIERFDGEIIEAGYLSFPIRKKINKKETLQKDQFYKEKHALKQTVEKKEDLFKENLFLEFINRSGIKRKEKMMNEKNDD